MCGKVRNNKKERIHTHECLQYYIANQIKIVTKLMWKRSGEKVEAI